MIQLSRPSLWFSVVATISLGACKSAWTEAQPMDNVLREQAARSSEDRDRLRLYLRDGETVVEGEVSVLTVDSLALVDDSASVAREDIERVDVLTGQHPAGVLIAVAFGAALLVTVASLSASSAWD